MKPDIVTIGVYGFDSDGFFQALLDANVDTFCDLRLRRGMRGSKYAFVNSESLQRKLGELGIRYLHVKALAPNQEVREKQAQADTILGVAKRERRMLASGFIQAYEAQCLSNFDLKLFIEQLGSEVKVVGLFCVESEPEACHRSLVAKYLSQELGLRVEHIKP